MIDVVYVVGTGSPWQDGELRFSLRSLEKFVSGIGNVYIVGHCPRWATNVFHLQYPDPFPCKERNIMLKMARICGHPDLSETWLSLHDDHFALDFQEAGEIPNYSGGSLERMVAKAKPGNNWREAVQNTNNVLKSKNLPTHNFDIHTPILIDKEKFPAIMDSYNWKTPRGYVVKSLYANTIGLEPTPLIDIKLNQRYTYPDLVARLKGRPWFSTGNGGLSGHFKNLLHAIFPEPSKYEN